jgi:hypothetical protein
MIVRTLDQAMAFVDQSFEDGLRKFQTATLTDIPGRLGYDLDPDQLDQVLEQQRAEYQMWRTKQRAKIAGWLAASREDP